MTACVVGSAWLNGRGGNRGQLLLLARSIETEAASGVRLAARCLHQQRNIVSIQIAARRGIDGDDDLAIAPAKLPVALAGCAGKSILRNPQRQAISGREKAPSVVRCRRQVAQTGEINFSRLGSETATLNHERAFRSADGHK